MSFGFHSLEHKQKLFALLGIDSLPDSPADQAQIIADNFSLVWKTNVKATLPILFDIFNKNNALNLSINQLKSILKTFKTQPFFQVLFVSRSFFLRLANAPQSFRLIVLQTLFEAVGSSAEIDAIFSAFPDLHLLALLDHDDLLSLQLTIIDTFGKYQKEKLNKTSCEYNIKYLTNLSKTITKTNKETDKNQLSKKAISLTKSILASKTVYSFEEILDIKGIKSAFANDKLLWELLTIFNDKDVKVFNLFLKANQGVLKSLGLDRDVLLKKIQLLTLAGLGNDAILNNTPIGYSYIAGCLEIDVDMVELFIIEGINSGLINGKINQIDQNVEISRSTIRSFDQPEWVKLGDRIEAWKSNLDDILNIISKPLNEE